MKNVSLLGVVALVALAGCADRTSTAPSAAVPAPANVSGTWTGALVTGAPVTMTLKQTGANVAGDLQVGGRSDISGPIVGAVEGNTIRLEARSGFGTAPLLNVRGDQITGTVGGTMLDVRRAP